MSNIAIIAKQAQQVSDEAYKLSEKINELMVMPTSGGATSIDPFIFALTIFVLSCFIGYYVVWKVTPSLHTPLMAVTNAISGIIIIGAMIAVGPEGFGFSQFLGLVAVIIASINIFGGFIVTNRMLEMFKKK
jgi:NAD(P) transhydrogenase subunit alpha